MAEGTPVKRQAKAKITSGPSRSMSTGATAPKTARKPTMGASAPESAEKPAPQESVSKKSVSKPVAATARSATADSGKLHETKHLKPNSAPIEVKITIAAEVVVPKTTTKPAGKTIFSKEVAGKTKVVSEGAKTPISAKAPKPIPAPKIKVKLNKTSKAASEGASTLGKRAQKVIAEAEKPLAAPQKKAVAIKVPAKSSATPAGRQPAKAAAPMKEPSTKQAVPKATTRKSAPKAAAAKTGGRKSGTAAGA